MRRGVNFDLQGELFDLGVEFGSESERSGTGNAGVLHRGDHESASYGAERNYD